MPNRSADNLHPSGARRQCRLAAVALLALAACGHDASPPASAGGDASRAPAPEAPAANGAASERPELLQGSILLEGMREPMTYRLFRAPPGFPLQFSTYVPEDMRVEESASEHGAVLHFLADFGPPSGAGVTVLAPERPLGAAEARELLGRVVQAGGEAVRAQSPAYPWALEEYEVGGASGEVGRAALARHRDRFFLILVRYPAEMGDGMAPRVQRVLDEWRWRGGGALGS